MTALDDRPLTEAEPGVRTTAPSDSKIMKVSKSSTSLTDRITIGRMSWGEGGAGRSNLR